MEPFLEEDDLPTLPVCDLMQYTRFVPRVFVPMRCHPVLKEWVRGTERSLKATLLRRDNTASLRNLYGPETFRWPDGTGHVSNAWVFDYGPINIVAFTDERGTRFEVGHNLFQSLPYLKQQILQPTSHTSVTCVEFLDHFFKRLKSEPAEISMD